MQPSESPAPAPVPPRELTSPPPRLGRLAFVLLLLVVIAGLAGLVPRWRQRETLRAETRDLAVPGVLVVSPVPGLVSAGIALPAEVKAYVEAPIYARASGYLKRWLADLGTNVAAGQLLAEIDTPELHQELARARAQLAQADAAASLARLTADRWAELLKAEGVSAQEAAEKQSDLALKSATVEAARAEVRRLEEMQSFDRVTAPFAGIITARLTDVGHLVSATGGRELFRLAQTGTLRVFVRVPQSTARTVAVGQSAELTLPEIPGRVFAARVARTSGVMDAQSRTLLTELELDNSRGEILAGSYAQVRFPAVRGEAALTLPANTLLFRAEGPQVGVIEGDGRVELRSIKIGRDFGSTVEILSGVTAPDRVIVNPSDSLTAGVQVRIIDTNRPAPPK